MNIINVSLVYTHSISRSTDSQEFQSFLKLLEKKYFFGSKFGCKIEVPVICDQYHIGTVTITINVIKGKNGFGGIFCLF